MDRTGLMPGRLGTTWRTSVNANAAPSGRAKRAGSKLARAGRKPGHVTGYTVPRYIKGDAIEDAIVRSIASDMLSMMEGLT